MKTHTQGPWFYDGEHIRAITKTDGEVSVAVVRGWLPEHRQEEKKNAYLIAAAPELLEALIELTEIVTGLEAACDNAGVGDLVEVRDAWRKADAAIAKANGETP